MEAGTKRFTQKILGLNRMADSLQMSWSATLPPVHNHNLWNKYENNNLGRCLNSSSSQYIYHFFSWGYHFLFLCDTHNQWYKDCKQWIEVQFVPWKFNNCGRFYFYFFQWTASQSLFNMGWYRNWLLLLNSLLNSYGKTVVSPLLMHWQYHSLSLSYRCILKTCTEPSIVVWLNDFPSWSLVVVPI